jgi:succinate-semialdehyde dehydrogenase / glutarate-semialdehyde dehydrogenase
MQTYGLYVNGEWRALGETIGVRNPATGEEIGRVAMGGREVVREALAYAQRAFEEWRGVPAKERGELLLAVGEEMERRGEEIARTMTAENGKPLAQSRAEVELSVDHLRWFAEEGRRGYGRVVAPQKEGKRHVVVKVPVGVVGAITPWNFPLLLAVRKVAPAVAAGCAVVLKPSEVTPLCGVRLAECFDAAARAQDAPGGVFQMVLGDAAEVAGEFMENAVCRKVTFTGSTQVGKKLIHGAAGQVKKLSLELGGQAPLIVFDDAELERTIEAVMVAKFRNAGQSCIAANRFYVQAGIYERFVERFVERVKGMKIGDGMEEGVDIGPLVDEETFAKAMRHVEDAKGRGARVLCGGRRWEGDAKLKGQFMEPTVMVDVPGEALCMNEETFGPVAPIRRFEEEAEAVRQANATRYGLAAYVYTRDVDRVWRMMEQIEAGMICVNDGVPTTSNCPFGGMKESGWGRELGSEGLEAFVETKHISFVVR